MPVFSFTARDRAGKWHKGKQAADNAGALAIALRPRGWSLVKAEVSEAAEEEQDSRPNRGIPILPATSLDIEMGLRMLASMLKGGITLLAALKTCADEARRARMAHVWDSIHDRIAGGMPLAEAMEKHGRLFPQLATQLTRAGELSGNLEIVLNQAGRQLERKRNLMVSLVSALMYPTITMIISILVTAYLMVKVIPEIVGFINSQGKKLPAVTVALIATSDFFTHYIYHIVIGGAALCVGLYLLHRWPPAGRVLDYILLKTPIFGRIFRLAGTALFARGLAMLLEAGVPMLGALETAGSLVGNKAIGARVKAARLAVLGGSSLAKPLAVGGEFFPMLPRMIAVGETTGTLSTVLLDVADFHEQQLESFIKRMTVLIEPVMTVVVGGIVGFVYLAFFFAIYSSFTPGGGG